MTAGDIDPALAALLATPSNDPAARRAAVLALRHGGRLRGVADKIAAAAVLVESDVRSEVEAAHALAVAAMASDARARLVAATAFDRLRLLAGRPQKFGTQMVGDGATRRLWTVDPATTDSERAKWGVPALAELQRRCAERGD